MDATKCSACSLTVLNAQLQNSTLSKFVIQEKDPSSITSPESVVNTFLSLPKKTQPLTSSVK